MDMHTNNHSIVPKSDKKRIIIAGGGFGGITLLQKLDTSKYQVVLLDRFNYHTFQPLLYQVATAGLEPDSVSRPLRKIISNKNDIHFRMLKVIEVNTQAEVIKTIAGDVKYDYLILATGAKMNFFNNDSIAKNSFPLKQVTHALDLRSHIFQQFEELEFQDVNNSKERQKYLNFVVVGAGPTGVEICGALSELKKHILPKDYPNLNISDMKITLVEGLKQVLPAMSEKSGIQAQKYLEKMGVKILLNTLTENYDGNTVELNNGDTIETKTLVWAAGVKGNIPLGFDGASIEKGKLRVNKYHQVVKEKEGNSYTSIYAIGDAASMEGQNLPGLAQVAIQQGKNLGNNLNHSDRKPKEFIYINKGALATIGRAKAVGDLPKDKTIKGLTGWLVWLYIHLKYLVGFRNKIVVLANWIWNYFRFDYGIRLIIRPSSKENSTLSKELKEEMKEY